MLGSCVALSAPVEGRDSLAISRIDQCLNGFP
jgi:hypothetical protein